MDERVFRAKIGKPIPDWDKVHRLHIDQRVAPIYKDTATTFRINSTFMDVSEQPFMIRQWFIGGILTACIGILSGFWTIYQTITRFPEAVDTFFYIIEIVNFLGFGYCVIKYGRDEFFSLKRRPIRFNRKTKTISTIRRRRFFNASTQGDITWDIPWNDKEIFCLHKGTTAFGTSYFIRHYQIDGDGNVIRAFALGREWAGTYLVEEALAQWNYWCWYMNQGPADLPKPRLFLSEHESPLETFLFCLYDSCTYESIRSRIFSLPFTLILTSFRLLSIHSCRDPIWPPHVAAASVIADGDPYDQPSGDTPVGWGPTARARDLGTYPLDPKMPMPGWRGEPNPTENAYRWAADIPPAPQPMSH
jgi:hypothetical protein